MVETTSDHDANYICSSVALALRPEQLSDIRLEERLLSKSEFESIKTLRNNTTLRFIVSYNQNFWRQQGYSGQILSAKGPIIWAMERPVLSGTGSEQKYHTIVGCLSIAKKERENDDTTPVDNRDIVLGQLKELFGEEALEPVVYRETEFADICVPECGTYVALRKLMDCEITKGLEWAALDVYGEGDLGASLEAGYTAYLHLVNTLRPQARSFSDMNVIKWQRELPRMPLTKYLSSMNYVSGLKYAFVGAVCCCAYYSYKGELGNIVLSPLRMIGISK